MKISHFIPENPPYEGIFCSFQALVMPVKPLVGSSSLPTLILVLKGMVQGEWGDRDQVLGITDQGSRLQVSARGTNNGGDVTISEELQEAQLPSRHSIKYYLE